MNKFTATTFASLAALTLAACGSSDDASVEAQADTVEMPANEAVEAVAEAPAEDANADAVEAAETGPSEAVNSEAEAAGDAAVAAVADVAAIAAGVVEEVKEAELPKVPN